MMGARGGWFLPAKTNLSGEPTAFIQPFLDVNKITQETGEIFFDMTKRTTDVWERFIVNAQEDWEDLESRGLGIIQESAGVDEDDDVDDDDSKTEGVFRRYGPQDRITSLAACVLIPRIST